MEQKKEKGLRIRSCLTGAIWLALVFSTVISALLFAILNRRFNAAKELLRFTIQPMSEVITESGIGNEDLFYQLFRENENMTPEEYRKNWAQWIKD